MLTLTGCVIAYGSFPKTDGGLVDPPYVDPMPIPEETMAPPVDNGDDGAEEEPPAEETPVEETPVEEPVEEVDRLQQVSFRHSFTPSPT